MKTTDTERKVKSVLSLTDWRTIDQIYLSLNPRGPKTFLGRFRAPKELYSRENIQGALHTLLAEHEIETRETDGRKTPTIYRRYPYER